MKSPPSLCGTGMLVWLLVVVVMFFVNLVTQAKTTPVLALM